MRLLTATRQGQGEHPGDFCFATDGELVLVGAVCAADEADPDGGCGCGRAFSGLSSHRATTTAVVRNLDLSFDDVRLAVEGYYTATGMGADVLGDDDFAQVVAETLDLMVDIALAWPEGTLVGRRLNHLVRRAEPAAATDH